MTDVQRILLDEYRWNSDKYGYQFFVDANANVASINRNQQHRDIQVEPQLIRFCLDQIFRFSAERFNVGRSPSGTSRVLSPDARNLPEVLANLQWVGQRWSQYKNQVRLVLPEIE